MLLVAVALATTPEEQALFDELLGPPVAEEGVPVQGPPMPIRPQMPWWPAPTALVGMGLLWAARTKLMGRFGDTDGHVMVVHSRIQLGQGSGLAVVEIETPDGPRMLLMGVGSGGPPCLLADLDDGFRDHLIDEILDHSGGQR